MLLIILLIAEIIFCTVSKQFSPLPRNDQLKPLPFRKSLTKFQSQNLVNEDECIWSIKNSYKTDLDQKTSNKIYEALSTTCNGEIAIHLEDNTHSESLIIKDYLSKTEVSIEGFNTLGIVIGQTEWSRDIENDFILTIGESSTISLRLKNIIFIGAGAVKLDGDSWVLIEQSSFQLPITTRNDVVGSQYPFISATKGVLEVKQCSFGTDEIITNIGSPAIQVKSGCIKFICSISSFTNLVSGAIDLEVGISSTAQIEESKFNKCGSEFALSGGVYVIGQYNEDEEDCDDEDAPPPEEQPGSEPGYPGQEGYGQINNEQSNININVNIDHQNKTKKNKCKGDVETEPSVDPPGPLPHPRTGIKKYKSQYKHQIKSKSDSPVVYPCDYPIHGYPEQHESDDGQGSEGSDCYYYEDDYIYDGEIGKVSIKGNQFYECSGRIAGGILFGERVLPISVTGNHFFQNTAIDAEGAKDIIFQSKQLLDRAGGIELVASGYVQVQQEDQTYEGQVKISGYNSNFAQYLNCKTESKEEVDCKAIPEGGQVVIPMVPYPEEGKDIAIGIDDGYYDKKDISDDDSGNQLGVGVIVGIIVGCAAVVAVVAVIIVLVVYFKKSMKTSKTGIQQSAGNEVQINKE